MRRTRLIGALVLLIALTIALPWSLQRGVAAPDSVDGARITQIDAANYPEITLHVHVSDGTGQPVGGLGADDFVVQEDGQAVTIDTFAGAGEVPISAALVIDRSGSMADDEKIDGARTAAHAFVALLRPTDQMTVIAFNSETRTVAPLGTDMQALDAAIARIRPDGGTALYDSIVTGVDALRTQPGRRVLLLLTDGQDCLVMASCPDEYGSQSSLDEALAYAARYSQPVHVVGIGERGGDGIDEAVLQQIADTSGGDYYYAPDAAQLATLYRQIAGDAQREYALTYQSPRPFNDGTRRDITVAAAEYAGRGDYLQPHLIDVRSDPLVGLVLLLPIGALFIVLRRRAGQLFAVATPVVAHAHDVLANTYGDTVPLTAACNYCIECGRSIRSGARFCPRCGAPIHGITAELESQR